jgi:diacylglycerol kinase (ATP)
VHVRLIVNPSSGANRGPELLPLITDRFRPLAADLDVTVTASEDDITQAAVRATAERTDLLLIAGGDGTVNVALRALAAIDGAFDRLTLGVIPAGTGNDLAKALDLGEAPEAAIDILLQRQVIDVDLGVLNDRAFINVSAGGFVADVSAILTEELKDATGKLAYVIGGARALFGREPFSAEVRIGGVPPFPGSIELQMFAICYARLIGGGYPIAPDALIDDGLLDVFLVKRTPTLEFIALLQKVAAGQHVGDDRILHFRADELEVTFDRVVNVNTDGEVLEASRCQYHVRPRAVRFLCGPRPHAAAPPRPAPPWRSSSEPAE